MFGITEAKVEKWGKKKKVDKLIKAATNPKNNIRLAAVKAMGNVDNEAIINTLITSLRDREPEIRLSAIDSLLNIGNKISIEHIRSLISDTDPKVSSKAKDAVRILTNMDK